MKTSKKILSIYCALLGGSFLIFCTAIVRLLLLCVMMFLMICLPLKILADGVTETEKFVHDFCDDVKDLLEDY